MDLITLQFLQNKLELEISAIRQEYVFAAEKENPDTFVSLSFEEMLVLHKLVSESIKEIKLP